MPRNRRSLGILLLASCLGCGSSGEGPADTGGLGATNIPDPGIGSQVDMSFDGVSPNDTPDRATPLGTSTTADITVWITNNAIGGADNASNYFVFRSAPMSGTFIFRGCFAPPLTGMTASLWKVKDAKQELPPVATQASAPDGPKSACLTFDQTVLEPGTVYLFGLTATGGAGLYSL